MKKHAGGERTTTALLLVLGLPGLSALFLWLEHLTHFEFLLHVAAIPLEILVGAFLVERWLASREKEGKRRQLMYFKSYLFRSDLRTVFISNFGALVRPEISLAWVRDAGLEQLRAARAGITTAAYRSPQAMEGVIREYARARHVWHTFMEWAATNDFEPIFHDMIYILHFIQDYELLRKQRPDTPFADELLAHPRLAEKADRILTDGIAKFLDYAIELRQKEPEVLDELLEDYLLSEKMRGAAAFDD
jgi:hypothetical protein